jgi:tetratricopeptide (TPR) repeat protein
MNPDPLAPSQGALADPLPAAEVREGPAPAPRAGAVLGLLALLLAGLLASAPIDNSDLFRHGAVGRSLSAGRLPAQGVLLDGPAGRAPASSWLYDVVLYACFRLLGGPALAALGACLAALLALVLFLAGRSLLDGRGGASTVGAGAAALLASVALGPWLALRTGLVSCLFLALTLLLLGRMACAVEEGSRPARARATWWLLPALVVLWVNTDGWVVLGPLAIVLVALGEWLRGRLRAARALAILFPVALAATLINPDPLHTWMNLPRLLHGEAGWGLPVAPFSLVFFRAAPPAAVAFWTLAVVGLAALALQRRGVAWALAPLSVVLFGLAAWRPAAAPFFVVVAGPAASLGLAELSRRAPGGRLARVVRGLAVLVGVLLVGAAWPGWLQGGPHGRRTWSLTVDRPLRDAVQQVVRWQQAGALGPQARALTLSPEAAAYWAWFGPDDLALARAGHELAQARSEVMPALSGPDLAAVWSGLLGSGDGWRDVLRRRHIRCLLLTNCNTQPVAAVVTRLAALPEEWPLLYLRGSTVVLGWRDPEQPSGGTDPFAALRLDLEQRAFRPTAEDRAPAEAPREELRRRPWWQAFVEPAPPQPSARDEAALYLAFFDAQRPRYQEQTTRLWLATAGAGLVAGLVDPTRGAAVRGGEVALRLAWVQLGWRAYAAGRDDGPPGLPLLAIRAARRALRDNPRDAHSYFLLGEAYLRLMEATRERDWRQQLTAWDRTRQAQAITAFSLALALRPDSAGAHGRLVRLYRESGSLDLALRHLRGLIDATRKRGVPAGESPETFDEGLAQMEEQAAGLEKEVQKRESAVREAAGERSVLVLARLAAAQGLPGLALQTLLKSDSSEFGPEGSQMELDLLLLSGRVDDVRTWAIPQLKASLGAVSYHALLARTAAALGDYDEAARHLREVAAALERGPGWSRPAREQGACEVARAIVQGPLREEAPALLVLGSALRQALLANAQEVAESLRREANAQVVRGLVALEAGEVEAAREAMRLALAVWKSSAAAVDGSGIDFTGRRAAQECLRWLKEPGPASGTEG